jgi:hypothetical protein
MKFELFKEVALAEDIPEHGLKEGDVATVVDYLTSETSGALGYALEVFNTQGETVDVIFVAATAVKSLSGNAVWHERALAKAV